MSNTCGFPFFEVSAKTNTNIDKLFYTMVSKIHGLKVQEEPTRNSQSTRNVIKLVSPKYILYNEFYLKNSIVKELYIILSKKN